jgi:phosphonate transport system substrate-binding protein
MLKDVTTPKQKDGYIHTIKRQTRFWFLGLIPISIMVVMFLVVGHGHTQDTVRVHLNEKSDISPVQEISTDTHDQFGDDSLQVAIAGVLSPTMTLQYYQDLLDNMERKLGRRIRLILKPTYTEVNDLIRGERVDVGFVCSLAYVKGSEDFGMELLAVPQVNGETVYYSYLIVSQESGATALRDLRNASFAFTDPISNSGHLVPTYQLSLLGEAPVSFFGRYLFTYSHDTSIIAVADKLVDGAAVDSLVYDQLVISKPEIAEKTKIIARWGPYGIPPVVVSPTLDPQLKQQLYDFFLDLHKSDEGKEILNNLTLDKFVVAHNDNYELIRKMKTKLGW